MRRAFLLTPCLLSWFCFGQLTDCQYFLGSQWPGVDILEILEPLDCNLDVGTLFYIPAGTFTQGTNTDPCRRDDETPFTHTLTRDILVMETEVTRQIWADLRGIQPSLPDDPTDTSDGAGMDNPVQNITWYEAILFANILSAERALTHCYYKDASFTTPVDSTNYTSGDFYCDFDANGYRLPSEGEWEYFTRAGTTGQFWTDDPFCTINCFTSCINSPCPALDPIGWSCENVWDPLGYYTTKPVGLKEPNPWGLKDVHGNVFEACWDWKSNYPSGSVTDYTGSLSGEIRVARGGCWYYPAWTCRSAFRGEMSPSGRSSYVGFRLVRNSP